MHGLYKKRERFGYAAHSYAVQSHATCRCPYWAAAQIKLNAEEVSRLEKVADETGVQTLQEWEWEMA